VMSRIKIKQEKEKEKCMRTKPRNGNRFTG
jgi:hypothetical protein